MDGLNPLDWTAGPFLTLYVALAGGILLLIRVSGTRLGGGAAGASARGEAAEDLGVLHLAYLAGGAGCAADTALVALAEAGAAVPDKVRGVMRFDPGVPVPPEFQPFRHVTDGESTREAFQSGFGMRWERIRAELARRGLVPDDAAWAGFRLWAGAGLCVPLLLGGCKVTVGIVRDKPVGILVVLLLLTAWLGAVLLGRPPLRNGAGGTALAAARLAHARAARAPLPEEMALAFALSGTAVLAGAEYGWFLQQRFSDSSGDSGSSSGGDGGGDGGGGCGGCSG